MIHFDYKLERSKHHGVGLFTKQDLKKGDVVYTASPLLDVNITKEQFDALSEQEQNECKWWGYFDEETSMWHVDFDVSKFLNHSYDANITRSSEHAGVCLVALRDITAGEELVQNYLEFESEAHLEQRGIALK